MGKGEIERCRESYGDRQREKRDGYGEQQDRKIDRQIRSLSMSIYLGTGNTGKGEIGRVMETDSEREETVRERAARP